MGTNGRGRYSAESLKNDPRIFRTSAYHGLVFAGDELEPEQTKEIPDDIFDMQMTVAESESVLDYFEKVTRSVVCGDPHYWWTCNPKPSWTAIRTVLTFGITEQQVDAYCMLLIGGGKVALCEVSNYSPWLGGGDERPVSCEPTEDAVLTVIDVGSIQFRRDEITVVTESGHDSYGTVDVFKNKTAIHYMTALAKGCNSRLVGINEDMICILRTLERRVNAFVSIPYSLE